MSLAPVAVAGAVASAQGTVVARFRRGSRYVDHAAAVLLILAGLYVTGYGSSPWPSRPGRPSNRDGR